MSTARNRRTKDRKQRQALRRRLEDEGAKPWVIEKALEQHRWESLVERHGIEEARRLLESEADDEPDDRGYRPSAPDPLLTGAARATGVTAKVARRRETITRWQYDRMTSDRGA